MRYFESRRGGNPRASHGATALELFLAKRHHGGIGVQPGWQILGGIGEIGLWCGLGSGKRRNWIKEDGTGQEVQTVNEERRQVTDNFGIRVLIEVSRKVSSIGSGRRLGLGLMVATPTLWEVG